MESILTLIMLAKSGDKKAYGDLYSLMYVDLYRSAYYILRNRDDAEDVVSETFLEGYKGIHNLRDDKAFKGWMYKILIARCNRKKAEYIKNRKNVQYEEVFEDLAEEEHGVYENQTDKNIDLYKAIATLSAEERTIILLFVVHGYKIKEIASVLDVPLGTISSKIHRTLKKLRKFLEE